MPPRASTTREDVVRAALDVVRREGMAGLSSRKVARHLGTSTAPVYHYWRSMEELSRAVLEEIKRLARRQMSVPRTERHFLNLGMGFAIFARDEPMLFRAFHLENREHRDLIRELFAELTGDMLGDPRFADMRESDRAALLFKMWTFTFGLAIQMSFRVTEESSDAYIKKALDDTGTIIIKDALQQQAVRLSPGGGFGSPDPPSPRPRPEPRDDS